MFLLFGRGIFLILKIALSILAGVLTFSIIWAIGCAIFCKEGEE